MEEGFMRKNSVPFSFLTATLILSWNRRVASSLGGIHFGRLHSLP